MTYLSLPGRVTTAGTASALVKKGARTWGTGTLDDGSALITARRFKRAGTYQLTIKYLGDAVTRTSEDTVTIRVVRRR